MKRTPANGNDNGQAILEFALAMPFLLAFIFFIVDCGLFAFRMSASLTNAVARARVARRSGGTQAAVSTRVSSTLHGGSGVLQRPR